MATKSEMENKELEALRAELEALKAEKAAAEEQKQRDESDIRRRVKIKLMRDDNKHRQPLYVAVNDYTANIQRGVTVEVPYYVALAIKESQDADEATAMMITELSNDTAAQEKRIFG